MGHGGNSRAGALACHEEAAGGARLFFLLLAQLEPVDFVARPDSCEAGVVPLLPDALRLVAADSAAAAGVAGPAVRRAWSALAAFLAPEVEEAAARRSS